jgi:hydrogenase maturation protein HypF
MVLSGRVQGVGFRPYVYVLANQRKLRGYVSNNEEGVIILLTGTEPEIHGFYESLVKNPPPMADIKSHYLQKTDRLAFEDFRIVPSEKNQKLNLALTPDFGLCDACKSEISDPKNRRFSYPFTTCVNCGPRWAITNTFPFERSNTTLKNFEMCPVCRKEYEDPADRRFHSQTNTCSECGIDLVLEEVRGGIVPVPKKSFFKNLAQLIEQGKIIAIKNTGGYLICCDATNSAVIERLRTLKKRPKKPFAVLYPSMEMLEKDLPVNGQQRQALLSTQKPIVIMSSRRNRSKLALDALAPKLFQIGVMLPYTGILQLLSEELSRPVVATSGNIHGSPIVSKKEDALAWISGLTDYFVHHNLPIANPQDDSVVKYSFKNNRRIMFRRSRGFAPNFMAFTAASTQKVLAMGSHLKSTLSFIPNDFLYISQYLGNLDQYDVYERFVQTANNMCAIFEQEPDRILVDKHPAYNSTRLGHELSQKYGSELRSVQHHKAHFASVLGEYGLFDKKETILGVVWDGTGYGDDHQVWGGEFFTYRNKKMERLTHFEYFNWLAGDKMAKEPRLSLFSLTDDADQEVLQEKFTSRELDIYRSVKKTCDLKTSSVGRLFDAVASLLNLCDINTFEGEAAMVLENSILYEQVNLCKAYFSVGDGVRVCTATLWNNLYQDFLKGVEKEKIILNFLYTLATIITGIASNKKIKRIALSGGVFQNTTLVDILKDISDNRFELYFNRNLAPNDENISYGQIMYDQHCSPDENGS